MNLLLWNTFFLFWLWYPTAQKFPWWTVSQGAVRVVLVIMLKRDSQIAYRCSAIRFWHHLDIVSLHRLNEAFRYTVALWASHRSRSGLQPDFSCKRTDLMGSICRTIICQPFHRWCWQRITEATFDRPQHDILHSVTIVTPSTGRPVQRFPIAAIHGERDT